MPIVWLFSLVLGHSRYIFARYVMHQDLQTLLRCHMQAFDAIGGVPIEVLYDRMKTSVTGEDNEGHIICNSSEPAGRTPPKPRAKSSYHSAIIREDFFLAAASAISMT